MRIRPTDTPSKITSTRATDDWWGKLRYAHSRALPNIFAWWCIDSPRSLSLSPKLMVYFCSIYNQIHAF